MALIMDESGFPVGEAPDAALAFEALLIAAKELGYREGVLQCAITAEIAAKEYADNGLTQPSEACAMLARVYRALKGEGR